ncbi:hypothetical protein DFP72DRAFT_1060541 [Ephemerocybe angulata]|uniref:Uncharacterized protein n=1 Tax=Ephemerocybe angulata TaxID=980116 RepID=A0A8H6IF95_9AGAR|nr:hypothetical protein DFP72DRAFT_1060541 [Tulosesus angulatus]
MNPNYDLEKAKRYLDSVYATQGQVGEVVHLAELQVENVWFQDIRYPPSQRLMHHDEGEPTEVIVKMQGILCAAWLPPIKRAPSTRTLSHIRNLKQHVKITSLGSSNFDAASEKLDAVHALYTKHVGSRTVLPLAFTPYEGHRCVESHARYFTDRNLVPYVKNERFARMIDPNNVLASIQPDVFVHGPDNQVEYCRALCVDEGKPRYEPYDPACFKAGDVVELSFAFVGIPIKDQRSLLFLNLKALTMLTDTFRKDSQVAVNTTSRMAAQSDDYSPKRRRLYVDMDQPVARPGPKAVYQDAVEENQDDYQRSSSTHGDDDLIGKSPTMNVKEGSPGHSSEGQESESEGEEGEVVERKRDPSVEQGDGEGQGQGDDGRLSEGIMDIDG